MIEVLSPINTERIAQKALADRHGSVMITHGIYKDGEVVGSFSYNQIPLVLAWFHSKDCKVRDLLDAINNMEEIMKKDGTIIFAIDCPDDSPVAHYMGKLGFVRNNSKSTLYLKRIK